MDEISDKANDEAIRLFNDFREISFLEIAAVCAIAWFAIWLVRRYIPRLAESLPSTSRLYVLAAVPVFRLVVMLFATLWIVPLVFNVTMRNFFVIASGASVAIGFAFKDYVSSLIAGIVAVFERPYRPGDWVRVGSDYGEVMSVGLRAFQLRTPSDDIITIPHLNLWTNSIANSNNGDRTLMCVADLYVSGNHDVAELRHSLRDVALTSAYLDISRPVAVMLCQMPWGTHYKIKAYPFDMRDQFAFVSDLTVRANEVIAQLGLRGCSIPAIATQ